MAKPSRDLVRGVPLFANLSDADADKLAADFIERRFAAGDTISTAGESGLNFFIVESGEAAVRVGDKEVRRLAAGDSFGEIALVDKGPRSASVTAITDMRCHGLPVWSFRSFSQTRPDVTWKLLELLADYLREAQMRTSP